VGHIDRLLETVIGYLKSAIPTRHSYLTAVNAVWQLPQPKDGAFFVLLNLKEANRYDGWVAF
jgi:hypothetical protein